jgi:hypothetical protein
MSALIGNRPQHSRDYQAPRARDGAKLLIVCFVFIFGAWGCASSAGNDDESLNFVRAVHWNASPGPGKHSVVLTASVRYCVYTMSKPRIHHVDMMERPNSTTIKMAVEFRYLSQEARHEGCADVELGLKKRIGLQRALDRQVLLDGSFSPPRIRWPQRNT